LASVVCMHVFVFGAEMSPLEPIDGSKVSLLAIGEPEGVEEGSGGVPVPDPDILRLKDTRLPKGPVTKAWRYIETIIRGQIHNITFAT